MTRTHSGSRSSVWRVFRFPIRCKHLPAKTFAADGGEFFSSQIGVHVKTVSTDFSWARVKLTLKYTKSISKRCRCLYHKLLKTFFLKRTRWIPKHVRVDGLKPSFWLNMAQSFLETPTSNNWLIGGVGRPRFAHFGAATRLVRRPPWSILSCWSRLSQNEKQLFVALTATCHNSLWAAHTSSEQRYCIIDH